MKENVVYLPFVPPAESQLVFAIIRKQITMNTIGALLLANKFLYRRLSSSVPILRIVETSLPLEQLSCLYEYLL